MAVRLLLLLLLSLSCACARRALPQVLDGGPQGPADGPDASGPDAGDHEENGPDAGVRDSAMAPSEAGPTGGEDAAPPGHDAAQQDAESGTSVTASEIVGGSAGGAFDDRDLMPSMPEVKSVTIRSGDRLDYIELALRNGTLLAHGGTGGSQHSMELVEGEAVTYARLCTGEHDGSVRIFFARLGTNLGQEVAGGDETDTCTNFMAPAGQQISGMHGRAGYEVDALGFLYTPLATP
jgi:hypothetical protein